MNRDLLRLLLIFFLAWLLVLSGKARAAELKYFVGVVPRFEQPKLYAVWRPVLDELEKRTGLKSELDGKGVAFPAPNNA